MPSCAHPSGQMHSNVGDINLIIRENRGLKLRSCSTRSLAAFVLTPRGPFRRVLEPRSRNSWVDVSRRLVARCRASPAFPYAGMPLATSHGYTLSPISPMERHLACLASAAFPGQVTEQYQSD